MTTRAKLCPKCATAAMVHAPVCLDCGHRFRTRFAGTDQQTQAGNVMVLPAVCASPADCASPPRPQAVRPLRPAGSTRLALWGALLLVLFLGALLRLVWTVSSPPLRGAASAASPAKMSSPIPAEQLYRTIGIATSLYDLDREAGRLGRVMPGTSPHTLLVSYDYPDRSVRVSLTRPDVTGYDYRVQEVALYRGRTLLQRHADMN